VREVDDAVRGRRCVLGLLGEITTGGNVLTPDCVCACCASASVMHIASPSTM